MTGRTAADPVAVVRQVGLVLVSMRRGFKPDREGGACRTVTGCRKTGLALICDVSTGPTRCRPARTHNDAHNRHIWLREVQVFIEVRAGCHRSATQYLLPKFGCRPVRKLTTVDLQAFFNSLSPDLSPKSIRLIHGTLRAALNQAKAWGMLDRNPAVGVKLPRKKTVKPTVVLGLGDIRRIIEAVKEPTKSMLVLIVFASMRPGEVLALRWKDILRDRIVVDERVYDDEFDEVKTSAGDREVPFDRHGVILVAIKRIWASNKKFRMPDDLVFANRLEKRLDRHNLLHRHLKPVAARLGLPSTIDFRSFRTMHASLMRRFGGRLEVARDNMGHAGSTGGITLDVYSKTWWDKRVEAVARIVEAVLTEPEEETKRTLDTPLLAGGGIAEWEPFGNPRQPTKL